MLDNFRVCFLQFVLLALHILQYSLILTRDEGSNESALSSSETEDVQYKSLSLLDDLDGAYVLKMGS